MFRVRASYNVWDQLEESSSREKTNHYRKANNLDWRPWMKAGRAQKAGILLPFALLALLVLLLPVELQAQAAGSIEGTVVDASGAVIAGATVQVIDQTKGSVVRETTSNADGIFRALSLSPGTYSVKISVTNMRELLRTGIVLDANQVLSLGQVTLSVGSSLEMVTVTAQQPLVELGTSDHSAVIDSREITEQSLNGRDFQSLIRTLPGVVSNDSSDFRLAFNNTDSFHVNGLRGSANNVFLDGTINTDVGANDGQYTQLSLDAVNEFKLQTGNFSAEYGRNPGVLIAMTTRSGGKQFHGTVYEFNRNTAYNANSWFNNHTGQPRSPLNFNQFGANIGGFIPVPKISPMDNKKLFFFFNYEGTRATRPNGGTTYNMPNPAMLGIGTSNGQADLSPVYRAGNMCDFNGGSTCVPIRDTNGNLVQNGQVFLPGTVQYDNAGEVKTGTPYPNNQIPASEFSANYPAMINLITPGYRGNFNRPFTPNSSGFTDLVQIPFQDTYTFYKNQYVVRVDYNISSKANFFFRYVDDRQQESQGFGIFSSPTYPVIPEYRKKPGKSWAWGLVNVISPTLTNEVIFGWNSLTQVVDIVQGTPKSTYDKAALGFNFTDIFPGTNTHNLTPFINTNDYLNIAVFSPGWSSTGTTLALTDNVTKVAGAHVVKFGIFANRNLNGQQPTWQENPSLNFGASSNNTMNSNSGLANMLIGNYTNVSQTNIYAFGRFRFLQLEAYAQDTWKATRRLTLDYGLRWVYAGPTYTVSPYYQNYFSPTRYNPSQAVQINIAPNIPGQIPEQGTIISGSGNPYNGILREGTGGLPKGGIDHRWNNFGPRFGFAYDLYGDGKTAVRGGAGIFYERIRQNNNSFDALGNPPLVYTPTIYSGNIDNISPALVNNAPLSPVGINAFDQKGKIPTTYGYNLGLQQQLPHEFGFEIVYVGNLGRHQMFAEQLEQLPLGTTIRTPVLANANNVVAAIVPYLGYNSINWTLFGANSSYNGLQTRIQRRFHNNLTLNADYTWSKAINLSDTDNSFNDIPDNTQLKRFYGPAGFDRQNVFNFNYVYNLPDFRGHNTLVRYLAGGWEWTGIVRFWSGPPLDVTSNGNLGNALGGTIRPDYVAGVPIYTSHTHNVSSGANPQWFNPGAFARPADGSFGDVGRNSALRGPGINNWDMSLFKNTNFTERVKLQLRFEYFNVFNHTQWDSAKINGTGAVNGSGGSGNGILSAPTAGQSFGGPNAGSSGQITNTRDPRILQLGGKLSF
jgi:Carboxypeptidase regulatory-like domain/TonB-dependent Receptor Plug Domain